METNFISLFAEIYKNSEIMQNHQKNETSEQRKNCKFCTKIMPAFVSLYLNREKQLNQIIFVDAKRTDEMILEWIKLFNEWEKQ